MTIWTNTQWESPLWESPVWRKAIFGEKGGDDPVVNYILQESGDKIQLEDGTGFLLLE